MTSHVQKLLFLFQSNIDLDFCQHQLAVGASHCGFRDWTTSTYTVHIRTSFLLEWEASILVPPNRRPQRAVPPPSVGRAVT